VSSPEVPHSQGCVSAQGFSLHADTRCEPQQRQKLERLCRYITRPALGHKRLRRTPAGEVVLQLKTPYRDGTTHLVMTPLEFLQRLAALVQRPRLHLIRFHGVLAPNAALRSQIVPREANPETDIANRADDPPLDFTTGPDELGAITQTGLRDRHHHLSAVRGPLDHPRGH
jgi:putative transposase